MKKNLSFLMLIAICLSSIISFAQIPTDYVSIYTIKGEAEKAPITIGSKASNQLAGPASGWGDLADWNFSGYAKLVFNLTFDPSDAGNMFAIRFNVNAVPGSSNVKLEKFTLPASGTTFSAEIDLEKYAEDGKVGVGGIVFYNGASHWSFTYDGGTPTSSAVTINYVALAPKIKKVIARETFGNTAYDTNNPTPQFSGWGSGAAWHWNWTDITTFTSTNGYIAAGSDSSIRLNNYDATLVKPAYWREPSGGMQAHLAIRDNNAYAGSWDTLVYMDIDISSTYSVTAIEFGYARARTLGTENHRSLNVEYRVDEGEWMQLDTSLIVPENVFIKWDYIVMPVNIKGQVLDIRFACIQPNEQIFLDDITVEASVPDFELTEDVITRETFGNTAYDTNNPTPQFSGWGSGAAWHWNWTDITTFTSTNGYITAGSDSSLRLNNYDATLTKPAYWREPSGGMQAHLAIRDNNAYAGSWDTLAFSNIDISEAFAVSAIEFGYARARTLGTETHRSLNLEYRIDKGAWMQLDTSLIVPDKVYLKWDYIVMPVNIKGKLLDIRFACIQPNEQIFLDDITIVGKVAAANGFNDFLVENIVVGTVDSPEDFTGKLNISWDLEKVTMIFDITDDSIVSAGTAYQVDNIEVYFDMDNSKNIHWPRNGGWVSNDPTYDDNDFQFRLVPGIDFSVNNTFTGATQEYEVTENGYLFKLTIPWDSLMEGFVPTVGTQIGFDLLISDNDAVASDANRNQITLVSKTDKPYNDPSLFGTLQFESKGTFILIPDLEAPGAASNLAATTDKSSVTLTWDNATDNIAVLYYNVYQNSVLLPNKVYPKQTANSLKISGLDDGAYSFELEAVDNSFNVATTKASVSVTITTVSVDELVTSKLSIYPNPVLNELNIRGIDNISKIEIISLAGDVIKTHLPANSINVAELSRGVYFLRVHNTKEVFTARFLKN